jgi:hypothetical protein
MGRRFWQIEPDLVAAAQMDAEAGGAPGDDAAARDALEQRCAEQLLDDEALRADLTDDEFQPLQDWALERLHERAAAIADPATPEAEAEMARLVECLRGVLRPVDETIGRRAELDSQAFSDGLARIIEALEPPLYAAEGPANKAHDAVNAVLPRLAARKDEANGVELVEQLVDALREGAAGGPRDTTSGPESA